MDDVPILDRARLELITRGDAALGDEFLNDLFTEGGELVDRLRASTGTADRGTVSDLAHTLKGLATELGAMRLRACAATLEGEADPSRWVTAVEAAAAALAELRAHVQRS